MGEMGRSHASCNSLCLLPFHFKWPSHGQTPVRPDKGERVTPKEERGRKETQEGDSGKGKCLEVSSPAAQKVQEQNSLSQC